MRFAQWGGCTLLFWVAALLLSSTGCADKKSTEPVAKAKDQKGDTGGDGKKDISTADAGHGWWCQEHGVPEEMCSQCMSEADAKKRFKDLGDWCKLHDRAQSQCFKCDPSLYAKFEAMYEAKYGEKPAP